MRNAYPDYWVDFICDILQFFGDNWDYVIIPDCRFPNEIERMKYCYDAVHLRVRRENYDSGLTRAQKNHPSETSLDDCGADFFIENNGSIADLKNLVNEWIKENLYDANE